MTSKEIYRQIIENIRQKNPPSIDVSKVENPDERNALLALEALYLRKNHSLAAGFLEEISENELEGFTEGLYKEASLAVRSKEEVNRDELLDLADETLEIFPEAAIALAIKGGVILCLGNIDRGIQTFFQILSNYPNAVWVYHNLVENLFAVRKRNHARRYLRKIQPWNIRALYYIAALFTFPTDLIYFIFFIWGFAVPGIGLFLFLIPSGAMFYAIGKKERILTFHFLLVCFILMLYIIFYLVII
jgi:tetratricopeptide (TPR) repeat protein